VKVLYVSKALVVAAYRAKLRELRRLVDVSAVVPNRWGGTAVEPGAADDDVVQLRPVLLPGWNSLHVYPRLGDVLDRERPQLVHVDEEPFSLAALQLVELARRRRIPAVFFAWENVDKWLPAPLLVTRRRVLHRAAGAIAGTPAAAEMIRRHGYAGPLAVIPQFGVDPEAYSPDEADRELTRGALGIAPRDFCAGFAGRLVPEKGVDVLVDAVGALPWARLLILGDGPHRDRLEARALLVGAGERTTFAGPVPSTEMPHWLRALDVLVLPSRSTPRWSEQFGRVLVEAMACGVPVIASRSGEIPHVVGDAGILVPEDDPPALRAALTELAADPERRARLAARGRERVLRSFTHAHIARGTASFYESLVGASAEARR
jgi:glycosyltransferase involved in cell wall biosynthesis